MSSAAASGCSRRNSARVVVSTSASRRRYEATHAQLAIRSTSGPTYEHFISSSDPCDDLRGCDADPGVAVVCATDDGSASSRSVATGGGSGPSRANSTSPGAIGGYFNPPPAGGLPHPPHFPRRRHNPENDP